MMYSFVFDLLKYVDGFAVLGKANQWVFNF